jgi:hypothetical protein
MKVTGEGPWVEIVTHAVVFPTAATLRGYPIAPVTHDENAFEALDECTVWTGTRNQGLKTDDTCHDWNSGSSDGAGHFGGTRDVDYERGDENPSPAGTIHFPDSWTDIAAAKCSELKHLLCFES